jgi:hypothetical protein
MKSAMMKPIPDPGADGIDDRARHGVLRSERLLAAEDHAVNDDQRDERAQRLMDLGLDRLQSHVGDRHERGDDQDIGRDPHLVRYQLSEGRDQDARADQHKESRQPHGEAVYHRVGDGQRRTESEHLDEDRVLAPDAACEVLARRRLLRHQLAPSRYASNIGPSLSSR